jgi:hypothetical protein
MALCLLVRSVMKIFVGGEEPKLWNGILRFCSIVGGSELARNEDSCWDYDAVWEDRDGHKWDVSLDFRASRGSLNLHAVEIASRDSSLSVSHSVLVELPLSELVSDARKQEFEAIFARRKSSDAHRGRAHSDEELQAVAEVYLNALSLGIPVQGAVAETFKVSKSTAAKRIMAARRSGWLDPPGSKGDTR